MILQNFIKNGGIPRETLHDSAGDSNNIESILNKSDDSRGTQFSTTLNDIDRKPNFISPQKYLEKTSPEAPNSITASPAPEKRNLSNYNRK